MSSTAHLQFHDEAALIERLSRGLTRHPKEVVFLVGSALCTPPEPGAPGVPGVDGVIDLVRAEFEEDPAQVLAFDQAISANPENRYQAAFFFLQGRRGQQAANEIIRRAVLSARCPPFGRAPMNSVNDDEECRKLELDGPGWVLSCALEKLGALIARYPRRFGGSILTTNFDPLIQVAIRRAEGKSFRTTLHTDGNLAQTQADGCHIVHLHGYWYGSDTLHTHHQLEQPRPHLTDSLSYLLRNRLVVVCGYGGWDDVFTEALLKVVRDETAFPEIIWTFHGRKPTLGDQLSQRLAPGINRGRVNLYGGIDCHHFFPALYDSWLKLEQPVLAATEVQSNPVRVLESVGAEIEARSSSPPEAKGIVLEGANEDRPPVTEICVGRERELRTIAESDAKVIFLTGIGGQGKSTVAAQYFAACQEPQKGFSIIAWRDCKEESERFESQLATLAAELSAGNVSGTELAKQDAQTIIKLLLYLIGDRKVLLVFDNVDHYVDLENGTLAGSPNSLVQELLRSRSAARIVFTCRPNVKYGSPLALSQRLEGLSLDAARELFDRRNAKSSPEEIGEAHDLTNGHAFWLDLLAIQVGKRASFGGLPQLVREIRSGGGHVPTDTLKSIWGTLRPREQTVLRAMAETVKPETEAQIGDYLAEELNYNRVVRSLNALRSLNLVVVKRRPNGSDLLELHPLVRQFVRNSFRTDERLSFIDAIIRIYTVLRARNKVKLSDLPPISILEFWTQNAELDAEAGRFQDAFSTLDEAAESFESSAYPREFCRAVRLLLNKAPWITDFGQYRSFDRVFIAHVQTLAYLGEHAEVEGLLDAYQKTVPVKDARYVMYCKERSHAKWLKGDLDSALEWARLGQNLKSSSGADISVDIEHQLALAERDSGRPEVALATFLAGRTLSEVLDPEELDVERGGAHYGNIGRCLHFMGQIESALICYQKSALIVEQRPRGFHVRNQAYIRAWIGELLGAREQYGLAGAFLQAAYLKWSQVSPPKAANISAQVEQMKKRVTSTSWIKDDEVERVFIDWVLGRNVDSQYS